MIEKLFGEAWLKSSRRPLVRFLLDVLGVRIVPYYLYLERPRFFDSSHVEGVGTEYEFGPMTSGDREGAYDHAGHNNAVET